MSTNSTIAMKEESGKIKIVYCHWDGYPNGVGKMLLNHYNTTKKVKALLELGNISSLEKSIECPNGHNFDNKMNGYSTFYSRDRGDKLQMAKEFETYTDALYFMNCQYNYFWDGEKWILKILKEQ